MDRLLDPDPGRCNAYDLLEDVNMLVLLGGCERTEAEFNALMAVSGFTPITPLLARPMFSLIETRPGGLPLPGDAENRLAPPS